MSDIKLTGILTADPSLSGELTPDPVLSSAALLPSGPRGPEGPMGRVYFPTFCVNEGMELIMKDDFGYDRNIEFELVDGYLVQKVG